MTDRKSTLDALLAVATEVEIDHDQHASERRILASLAYFDQHPELEIGAQIVPTALTRLQAGFLHTVHP